MRLAVIGTGYVGLVSGACLAEAGHDVVCVDIDEAKIAKLKRGEMPIYEPGLAEVVTRNVSLNRLRFTTTLSDLDEPAAIFFALPTPPGGDGNADLRFVLKAAEDVAKILKSYTVLINKSTVPVGTAQRVRDLVAKHIRVPFDVVSNPEFLREGFSVHDFMEPDRIIVGTTSPRARAVIEELYRPFTVLGAPLIFMDESSAELTKYAANSFLAMKITFMNEIANLSGRLGANVDLVKAGIGSDPRIGDRALDAGIGFGGSCFPKDVLALHRSAETSGYNFKLLKAVMDVNQRQKTLLVDKVTQHFGRNLSSKTFALWGLAFKPDTDDIREAPSLEIIKRLLEAGAHVRAYDPEAMPNVRAQIGETIEYAASAVNALDGADALLIATEWPEFASVDLNEIAQRLKQKLVFDGRNIFDLEAAATAGLEYVSIGRPVIKRTNEESAAEAASDFVGSRFVVSAE